MKQRLGVVLGLIAALVIGAFAAAPASADAATGAPGLQKGVKNAQKNVKKAKKKAKATCKKVKKARKGKAKKKAAKRCKQARKNVKKQQRKLTTAKKKLSNYNAQFFDVCKQGCKYRTIQAGADAAGKWQFNNKSRKATVRVQPGTYVEGVLLHGKREGYKFDNLTIEGVKADKTPNPDARQVVLEGKDAKTIIKGNPGWQPGDAESEPANNAIEGRSTVGLTLKNMWAKDYSSNTFFVWASNNPAFGERCADYMMDNLVSSDTRSYGLFARNCYGGTMKDSEGWNHGDSAFYIGETPCDSENWTNRGANAGPCQANPNWTVLDNITSHQNVLGYSGTNSKYVEIKNSTFYNNGAGIVPNTLDSEKFEPSGWLKFVNNDIFWNNYNYFSSGSEFQTVSNGLGEVLGATVNYPMGVGVVLFGSDSVEVRDNNIFGNEKWGAMTFSAPVAEGMVNANDGDDAKNLNNQFIDNNMGRNGADPNGIDFLNDFTGGGNCWSGNTPGSTFVLGNGSVPQATIYPACPQPHVQNIPSVQSINFSAGIQVDLDGNGDPLPNPDTILGYVAADPAKNQECSWTIATPHATYTDADGITYTEKRADPVTDCPVAP